MLHEMRRGGTELFDSFETGYNAGNAKSDLKKGETKIAGKLARVRHRRQRIPSVAAAEVEWIFQITFNVTLTAGEYVQFILMETYRNITSALSTTNWPFKPIPPYYPLSNGNRDYSSTIRNYNVPYRRRNSTNSPLWNDFTVSRNTKQLGEAGLSC